MNEQELTAFLESLMNERPAKNAAAVRSAEPKPAAESDPAETDTETAAPANDPPCSVINSAETELSEPLVPAIDAAAEAAPEEQIQPQEAAQQPADPPEESAEVSPAPKRRGRLLTLLDEQPAPEHPAPQTANAKIRARDAVFGVVLLLFAAFGLYTAVRYGISLGKRLLSAQTETEAVADCILPLVLMDIPDFETPETLSDDQFLTAAIWSVITDGTLAAYPESFEMRTVPAADIIAAGNARFGTERMPECRTIGFTSELRFYYDAEQDSFLLPAEPKLFTFVPEIGQITPTAEGVYQVRADYRAEQPSWAQSDTAQIVKTVEYTLTHSGDIWQIQAARQVS